MGKFSVSLFILWGVTNFVLSRAVAAEDCPFSDKRLLNEQVAAALTAFRASARAVVPDPELPKLERLARAQWAESVLLHPELKAVDRELADLQSEPWFAGRPRFIATEYFQLFPSCETMCLYTTKQYLMTVNPAFVREIGGERMLRFLIAHELGHAIVQNSPHVLVDAIAMKLTGTTFLEAAEILRQVARVSQKLFGYTGDLEVRARCLVQVDAAGT